MANYGTADAKGYVLITDGTDNIRISASWEDVKITVAMNFAGKVGAKRNILGKPLGKIQHTVAVNGLLVPASPGDEVELETAWQKLCLWGFSTTKFPYKLYFVYSTTGPNYHQFPNKAAAGFNDYLEGGVDTMSYFRKINLFNLNVAFKEYTIG